MPYIFIGHTTEFYFSDTFAAVIDIRGKTIGF